MIDVTELIKVIIPLIATLISMFLIPFLKQKLGTEKIKRITQWCEVACKAAEEAAHSGLIDKTDKYEYALTFLEKHNITFKDDEARALIDATVWELFNQFKSTE